MCTMQSNDKFEQFTQETRDVALAWLVELSGQSQAEYWMCVPKSWFEDGARTAGAGGCHGPAMLPGLFEKGRGDQEVRGVVENASLAPSARRAGFYRPAAGGDHPRLLSAAGLRRLRSRWPR